MPPSLAAPSAAATPTASTPMAPAVALVFPGQGSQRPQMAAAWRDHPAYSLWSEADDVLGRDVTRLGVQASAEELREPRNCQVALYVHHAVVFSAWRGAGAMPAVTAGHSLGEYNALLAAAAMSFADGLRLVDQRAAATQQAAVLNPGGMVACLGGPLAQLRDACAAAGAHVANDNADGQLVVSGDEAALERFTGLAKDAGAKVVRLEVGAAYHSPLMAGAVPTLQQALAGTSFANTDVPVIANVDAAPHRRGDEWPDLLARQVTAPVRWRESLLALQSEGVTDVVELGASAVLTGLAKRVTPQLRRTSITTPEQLEAA